MSGRRQWNCGCIKFRKLKRKNIRHKFSYVTPEWFLLTFQVQQGSLQIFSSICWLTLDWENNKKLASQFLLPIIWEWERARAGPSRTATDLAPVSMASWAYFSCNILDPWISLSTEESLEEKFAFHRINPEICLALSSNFCLRIASDDWIFSFSACMAYILCFISNQTSSWSEWGTKFLKLRFVVANGVSNTCKNLEREEMHI